MPLNPLCCRFVRAMVALLAIVFAGGCDLNPQPHPPEMVVSSQPSGAGGGSMQGASGTVTGSGESSGSSAGAFGSSGGATSVPALANADAGFAADASPAGLSGSELDAASSPLDARMQQTADGAEEGPMDASTDRNAGDDLATDAMHSDAATDSGDDGPLAIPGMAPEASLYPSTDSSLDDELGGRPESD